MVGIIALFIGQWVASAFTKTVLDRRAAAMGKPQKANRSISSQPRRKAGRLALHIISPRARLLAERDASYKALLSNGSIRPVPSAKWLSGQSVVCANGHRSTFGLFATLPGYGTFANLPDFQPGVRGRWAARLDKWRGTAKHSINDRDPKNDGQWELACPTCGTDHYTFVSSSLREYTMCTASADLFWVLCHLYRKSSGECPNCKIREVYWSALRSQE